MQGEATVNYTPIDGENIYTSASTLDFNGSSVNANTEGASTATYNIMWTYPGGINNKNKGWYYIFASRGNKTVEYKSDNEFKNELQKQYPNLFDSNGEFDMGKENEIIQTIDTLVYKMMSEILINSSGATLNYNEFATYFGAASISNPNGACIIIR